MSKTDQASPVTLAGLLATVCGLGRIGKAPGTLGSLAAIPLAWAFAAVGVAGLLAFAAVVFAVGWWASETYIRGGRVQDPPEVVIDEVAGQALTLAFAPVPLGLWWTAAGFALFRLFDIWKPWPVGLAERRMPGGLGIMADDVLAAVYAGLVLLAARIILGA